MKEETIMDQNYKEHKETKQNNKLLRTLLGIPVLYKVLLANSLIIFAGATGGTWLATNLNHSP